MYDYATQGKQNQIISLLENINSNLDSMNTNISYGFFSVYFIIVFCFVFFFLRSLLGGNNHD